MTRTYKYGVFAEMLGQALADNGITQAELADDLGLKQQAVSKWVKGVTRPRTATLTQLAHRFGWDETTALRAAAYLGSGESDTPPAARAERKSVPDRLTALEVRVAEQAQVLEEIRARLRAGEESP